MPWRAQVAVFIFAGLLAASVARGQPPSSPAPSEDQSAPADHSVEPRDEAGSAVSAPQASALAPTEGKPVDKKETAKEESVEKKWYDKLRLRGYAQVRFNEVTHLEPDS